MSELSAFDVVTAIVFVVNVMFAAFACSNTHDTSSRQRGYGSSGDNSSSKPLDLYP